MALVEALVGGTILAIGLAVLVSIATDASARQRMGEERIVAASLLDELLGAVLTEGAVDFPKKWDLEGRFAAPFEEYSFSMDIRDQGDVEPYLVTATVFWFSNGYQREETIQTYIAHRRGENPYELRAPGEPIER